ncbi:cytochrome P450 [Streptomyces sp. NPDC093085]|uniref:cytochrome P450 family protein n=1 Tax=Streptomyces sp. NPDC093085 TaxID=3155068 RepID=UPI0034176B44
MPTHPTDPTGSTGLTGSTTPTPPPPKDASADAGAGDGVRAEDAGAEDLALGDWPGFTADPYPRYAELRATGPVHPVRLPLGAPQWLVTDGAAIRAGLTDTGRLRNDIRHSASWTSDGGHAVGRNMLQVDPPDHTRLRRLVAREFTARRVSALRPRVQEIADSLLDAVERDGRVFDLVDAYGFPLPVTVICELLGVPVADRGPFRAWSAAVVDPTDPAAGQRANEEMAAYFLGLIERKRALPAGAAESDLLHAVIHSAGGAEDENGALDTEELLGMAFVLLVAGHETTAHLISSAVHHLLRHPDQLAALRADWTLLDGAIEETLRYEPPVQATSYRHTAAPVDFGTPGGPGSTAGPGGPAGPVGTGAGTRIAAGEPVMFSIAAANRDPERFPDPDRFDIHRDPAATRAHLSFGHGIHHCLGAPLARLEGAIALRTLLERFPDLTLADEAAPPDWRPGLLRGLNRLPLRR